MHNLRIVMITILLIIAGNCFLAEPTADATLTSSIRQNLKSMVSKAEPSTGLPRPFEVGQASYYSYECAQLPMANGKPFDPEKRTCASWFYDFGTVLRVKSLDTGRTTEVVVTDRGPNKRLVKNGRVIDLSRRAFEDICDTKKGLTRVIVTVLSHPEVS